MVPGVGGRDTTASPARHGTAPHHKDASSLKVSSGKMKKPCSTLPSTSYFPLPEATVFSPALLSQQSGFCGKVLVWPVEFSHWMNMKAVLDELVMRGHEVTVLISSASTITDANKPSAFKFEIFPVSLTKDDFENAVKNLIEKWTYMAKNSFWTNVSSLRELKSLLWEFSGMLMKMCKEVVSKKKLMTKLQESRFDVLLAEAAGPCGELLTEILRIPLVYSLRFSPGYLFEKYSGKLSFPPSYVPVIFSALSDHMTFMERVKNMLYVLYFDFWFQTFDEKTWNEFYSGVLGKSSFWLVT